MVGVRALLHWTSLIPPLALLALVATWSAHPPNTVLAVVGVLLAGAVLAAVDHAEVVAHRVGEPFGSLILAFAAAMITCNGIFGLSLLIGTLRQGTASFNAEGTATMLATVATLATLTIVLPTFTTSAPSREFSGEQLAFA